MNVKIAAKDKIEMTLQVLEMMDRHEVSLNIALTALGVSRYTITNFLSAIGTNIRAMRKFSPDERRKHLQKLFAKREANKNNLPDKPILELAMDVIHYKNENGVRSFQKSANDIGYPYRLILNRLQAAGYTFREVEQYYYPHWLRQKNMAHLTPCMQRINVCYMERCYLKEKCSAYQER
jgi:hypothetical protein